MARIRSIKPEFWKSEAIARLPMQTRLTFIALWSYVDDNGVGRDVEKLVAAELYPLEDDPRATLAMVAADLATLARELRIIRYTVAGKPFLSITNWSEHQKIDRPNKARYPGPDEADPNVAPPLTCDVPNPRETLASVARDTRAIPSPGAVDQGAGEQGSRGVPPTAGATTAPPDASSVIAAFIDGATGNGMDRPGPSIIGRVGKAAKKLIDGGATIPDLMTAATRLGANGWDDLEKEIRRVQADRNGFGRRTVGDGRASATDEEYLALDPILDRHEIARLKAEAS